MEFSTMASSKKVIARTTDNWNSNMAAQIGISTYFSGTMIDSVEIPTAILRFSTITSSKKVPPHDCDFVNGVICCKCKVGLS